jgi:hypothetical protein
LLVESLGRGIFRWKRKRKDESDEHGFEKRGFDVGRDSEAMRSIGGEEDTSKRLGAVRR